MVALQGDQRFTIVRSKELSNALAIWIAPSEVPSANFAATLGAMV